jgi:hypothetical protein
VWRRQCPPDRRPVTYDDPSVVTVWRCRSFVQLITADEHIVAVAGYYPRLLERTCARVSAHES